MNDPINPDAIKDLLSQDLSGIFFKSEELKSVDLGSGFSLRPIDLLIYDNDNVHTMLMAFTNTERIRKFLPSLDFSSKEKIQKWILGLCQKTEMGLEFAYGIYLNRGVIGMIFVNTPAYNKAVMGFPKWTMDFFIAEPLEGQGIMTAALVNMLHLLQSSTSADSIYALIDDDNARCLTLITKLPFDERDNSGFKNPQNNFSPPRVFECPLSHIQFE